MKIRSLLIAMSAPITGVLSYPPGLEPRERRLDEREYRCDCGVPHLCSFWHPEDGYCCGNVER